MPEKTKDEEAWFDAMQCNIPANSQQILQSAALFLTLLYHFYTVKGHRSYTLHQNSVFIAL